MKEIDNSFLENIHGGNATEDIAAGLVAYTTGVVAGYGSAGAVGAVALGLGFGAVLLMAGGAALFVFGLSQIEC